MLVYNPGNTATQYLLFFRYDVVEKYIFSRDTCRGLDLSLYSKSIWDRKRVFSELRELKRFPLIENFFVDRNRTEQKG